jgi:hypothetical protein
MSRRNRRRVLAVTADAREPLDLNRFEEEVAAEIGVDLHENDIMEREDVETAEQKD